MAPIVEQINGLFSVPQGNLIYALILTICAFAAWLACIYAKGEHESEAGQRMQLGLLFLFLVQLVLFGASWMTWLGVINGHFYLPPLDRTLALFSLVLIIWLWAVPAPNKVLDSLTALAEVVIVFFGGTSIVFWLREGTNIIFSSSNLGGFTFYSGFGLLLIGLILLVWQRPRYWGYGLLMLLVFLLGYLAQVFIHQPPSDYAWLVHLGEAVAFVFLLTLPKRLVGRGQEQEVKAQVMPTIPAASPIDGKLIQSVIDLITEPSPQKYYEDLTKMVAQAMKAELCLLLIPPKTGEQLIIPVVYDGSKDQNLEGFSIDGHKMPSIIATVKHSYSLQANGSTNLEVRSFAEALGLKQVSHLILAPFHPKSTNAVMGIAVLSKPNAPVWSEADVSRLKDVTETLLANVGRSKGPGWQDEQGEMIERLHRAEASADQVRLEYAQLKAKYDSIAPVEKASSQEGSEKSLQDDVIALEKRNLELESLLARGRPSLEEVEQLRLELRSALADLARIPSTLSRSDQRMLETQLSAMKSLDKMQPAELVTSIAQEFRQPLASIIGYTDLLLGESVGLLGAVQRKFLERVKAATERLGILMNELVAIVTIDGGKVDQTQVSVELEPLIHEAVGNIAAQLNEKNISIQLDLPEGLPSIQANKDAVLQILDNLLENACLITPVDGEIKLLARVEQREAEQNFILISVTDQGGGVERTDISRVFLRRYKMENPQIKGVGDMGVGLSIVKSLVELLKGRVWVDSQPGGSTFSVLLPLTAKQINHPYPNISSS